MVGTHGERVGVVEAKRPEPDEPVLLFELPPHRLVGKLRVRDHAPDVPVMLDEIIAQLLEKDPERRIPNAIREEMRKMNIMKRKSRIC